MNDELRKMLAMADVDGNEDDKGAGLDDKDQDDEDDDDDEDDEDAPETPELKE